MNTKLKFKIIRDVFLLIVLLLFLFIAYTFYLFYTPGSLSSRNANFIVQEGESFDDIAEHLFDEGLIRSKYAFEAYAVMRGYLNKLQAGEYEFRYTMNISEIAESLAEGKVISNTVVILIPEGFRTEEMEQRFAASDIFVNLGVFKASDFAGEFGFLADVPEGHSLEGYLFPDTYEFRKNITTEDVVLKILGNFELKFTQDLQREAAAQDKTIFEIVTMASLIEKEIPDPEEQKIISGILWKRLGVGMALQVDATIAFITGKNTTRLTLEDLRVKSPYNTYLNPGLPPGPIANPGLSALTAAVYPTESEYWFYLSKPSGETVFSRTLEEHNIAKNKYLR